MNKTLRVISICVLIVAVMITIWKLRDLIIHQQGERKPVLSINHKNTPSLNPLSITSMRSMTYPASKITIIKSLPDGSNFHQYITSYQSQGLKIYALLTIPQGPKPKNGWPVILFNHGYILPSTYETFPTVGQYASYYPVFSSNGYIVFKPDYRGNGNSEGKPSGAYFSPGYTIDDLNALSAIKQYKDADPHEIGIWAHSMGGNIALRLLTVDRQDIKAAVIWGGVVGSYTDILYHWHASHSNLVDSARFAKNGNGHSQLLNKYGTPKSNPSFWNSIDPTEYLSSINTPIQLDVGGADEEVPVSFSESLYHALQSLHKTVEYYEYPGDDHNISVNFTPAMQNSLDFFNKYLKGGENG